MSTLFLGLLKRCRPLSNHQIRTYSLFSCFFQGLFIFLPSQCGARSLLMSTLIIQNYPHIASIHFSCIIALVLLSIGLASGLTSLASLASLVPGYITLLPFSQFYLIVSSKFVFGLGFPYLTLATVVAICDTRALVVAVSRRRALKSGDFNSSILKSYSTASTSASGGTTTEDENRKRVRWKKKKKIPLLLCWYCLL